MGQCADESLLYYSPNNQLITLFKHIVITSSRQPTALFKCRGINAGALVSYRIYNIYAWIIHTPWLQDFVEAGVVGYAWWDNTHLQ
jgi:hypothetical protein